MTQLVTDAISVLMSAADVRAEQWAGVANETPVSDLVDELHEADAEEGARMCDIIEDAMLVVRAARCGNEYPTYTTEESLTAMIIQEWFAGATKFCRDHYTESCGAATLRARFLFCARTVDDAWQKAHDDFGYDDCFDFEFVPNYMEWCAQLDLQPWEFKDHQSKILAAMGFVGDKA